MTLKQMGFKTMIKESCSYHRVHEESLNLITCKCRWFEY